LRECPVCLPFADRKTFKFFLDNKCGNSFVTGGGINSGENDENFGFVAVCNPEFLPVDS
jgi:hypothetical protein